MVITLGIARYQRKTGPTYPVSGKTQLGQNQITYNLKRTHGGMDNHQVRIEIPDPSIEGYVLWKYYKLDKPAKITKMNLDGMELYAELPHQPPAGKLEYQVKLTHNGDNVIMPPDEPAVIRFKGHVPKGVLLPHVFMMFAALLIGMQATLSALFGLKIKTKAWVTLGLIAVGGLIFGPIVQKYAFGAFWTGWPLGEDWTDNKTAIMALGWIAAVWALRGKDGEKRGRWWVVAATILMFTIYLIPHSMHGSELDYSSLPADSLAKISQVPVSTIPVVLEMQEVDDVP
ncbi:MAG: hypothetical protein P9X24_19620 [Candidatus Hatepunaea meridiana]|nr:hypothetical protein [Candidatus Hatepunaea meridiana]